MTKRYIKTWACKKHLFGVGRISLRVPEYTQGILLVSKCALRGVFDFNNNKM